MTVVVVAYVSMRLLDLVVFAVMGARSGIPLVDALMRWDATWVLKAATEGYPEALQFGVDGRPLSSTLAWPPLVPLMARAATFGGTLMPASAFLIILNFVGGLVAAMILFRLAATYSTRRSAMTIAVAWSALPASAVLVMGYAEGLFCALVFGALLAMVRERWVWAGALVLLAGLTKLQAAPFAAVLLVCAVLAWRGRTVSVGRATLSVILASLAVIAWPAIVAVRLGRIDGYGLVQTAWGRSTVPFIDTARWLAWIVEEPSRAVLFSLAAFAVACLAGVIVWRQRNVPLPVRLTGVLFPLFLAGIGAGVSGVRYLLSNPTPAHLIGGWMGARPRAIALLGLLLMSQAAWIAFYAIAPVGSAPP